MSIDVFPATVLNSTLWNGQTYEEGTFTVTGTGFAGTAPSGIATYRRIGKVVFLSLPDLSGTSNATTLTVTGIPAGLGGSATRVWAPILDNGVFSSGMMAVGGTTITVNRDVGGTAWTASGAKGVFNAVFAYLVP